MKVVVTNDAVPFTVEVHEIIRVTGEGIAGSTIQIEINQSPLKVERVAEIRNVQNGSTPISTTIKEYELKPKDKGKAKVDVVVTPPQPGSSPNITVYEFEIQ